MFGGDTVICFLRPYSPPEVADVEDGSEAQECDFKQINIVTSGTLSTHLDMKRMGGRSRGDKLTAGSSSERVE